LLERFYGRLLACRELVRWPTPFGTYVCALVANTVRKICFIFRAAFRRQGGARMLTAPCSWATARQGWSSGGPGVRIGWCE
jgi:hypothetical protein